MWLHRKDAHLFQEVQHDQASENGLYHVWPQRSYFELVQLRKRLTKDVDFLAIRQGFRPQAVFCDMDGTLIEEESMSLVARELGFEDEIEAVTQKAMAGQMSFRQSLGERLQLLKGVPAQVFLGIVDQLTLRPGVLDFFQQCRERQIKTFVISGAAALVVEAMAEKLGANGCMGNSLQIVDGQLTGKLDADLVDEAFKGIYLQQVAHKNALDLNACVAFGDGANDKWMMARAGLSIGVRAKAILQPLLDGQLGSAGDFSAYGQRLFSD